MDGDGRETLVCIKKTATRHKEKGNPKVLGCITETEKAESEAQRDKPKGTRRAKVAMRDRA